MTKPRVYLLDYVAGNIRSLVNAIERLGWEVEWIKSPEDVESADKIILPGVGHFGHCLTSLKDAGYLPAIKQHIAAGKPFFGICVGLQALFAGSEEAPDVSGLNLVREDLTRFSPSNKDGSTKAVPCIGWNTASTVHDTTDRDSSKSQTSFYGLSPESRYYYVHSYAAPYDPGVLEAQGWTVATATYGDETYVGAIGRDNVFATQFHPEKSGAAGLRVIRAWLEDRRWSEAHQPLISNGRDSKAAGSLITTNGHNANPNASKGSLNNLTRRIIACLDVRANDAGDLVVTKGDQYDVREKSASGSNAVRNLGKPVSMAQKYYNQGADEITFLNITSFRDCPIADLPMLEILRQTSRTVFVPLTIGGGIRDMVDPATNRTVTALEVAKMYFASGADKVSIGSDAVLAAEAYWQDHHGDQSSTKNANGKANNQPPPPRAPSSIETISRAYGRQAVVVSVDPKRIYVSSPSATPHRTMPTVHRGPNDEKHVWYACTIKGGRETRDLDVIQLVTAAAALGAGEILLNAIDRDGSNRGFDLELIAAVKAAVEIPVIASSGAGKPGHFVEVFTRTATDAALGAGMFHRAEYTVAQVKEVMAAKGLLVRPLEEDVW